MASLGRDAGISQPTVRSWISVMEASYLITLLPPWSVNVGKRLVKSPKLYFIDPGLVCALTRLSDPESALHGPLGGPLMEGLVVTESRKAFAAAGLPFHGFHLRAQEGLEVDLIVEVGGTPIPVEVKLTATPRAAHAEPLRRLPALLGTEHPGYVVCDVAEKVPLGGGVFAISWREWGRELAARLR